MKQNKKITTIFSLCAALACISVAIGTTYAIFSTSKTVNNHLQINTNGKASINASLKRMSGSKDVATSGASTFTTKTLGEEDFSKENNSNVFGLEDTDYTIEGCKYIANMKLSNESDFSVNYDIKLTNSSDTTSTSSFMKELKVSYGKDESSLTDKGSLSSNLSSSLDTGVLEGNKDYLFTIQIEFPKESSTTTGDAYFDLVVSLSTLTDN